jgi:hypothetical protein
MKTTRGTAVAAAVGAAANVAGALRPTTSKVAMMAAPIRRTTMQILRVDG